MKLSFEAIVIGVILNGANEYGSKGLKIIKEAG
jgi:chemotaxis response regulator CheB